MIRPVILDAQSSEQLVRSAFSILTDYGYFTQCMWHVEDIHLLCQQRGWPELSHVQAKAIFNVFAELYEGEQGMTWAKLEQAIQVYLAQQGRMAADHEQRSMSAERIQAWVEHAQHAHGEQMDA